MTSILPNVAVIGKAGAGKSTVADILTRDYGYEKLSFAAPLKTGCGTSTDRTLLQDVGVGVRKLCPDFWVNLLLAEMARRRSEDIEMAALSFTRPGPLKCVIDDCRFPNEAMALAREGFVFVRIVAPYHTRVDRLKGNGKLQDEAQLAHESETALDDWDTEYRIVNDSHDLDLKQRVVDVLNKERR